MPELPEVETIRLRLRDGNGETPSLLGQVIQGFTTEWPRHVREPELEDFQQALKGRSVQDLRRRGKFLILDLDAGHLAIHLMMSGDLYLKPSGDPPGDYERSIFHLDSNWDLRFRDHRKLGRIFYLTDLSKITGSLGPEPLEPHFTADRLYSFLSQRKRALKPLLLDQGFIAGIGNIYADESLFLAGLHPLRQSHTLTEAESHRLWQGIRTSLQEGLRHNGTSIDWVYRGGNHQNRLRVYGREGKPCTRCGTRVKKIMVAQRGTHYCPHCQPGE